LEYGSKNLNLRVKRLTKEKRAILQREVFSLRFESPSTKEKRRCVMVSSGILSTARITFDKRETKMRHGIFRYSLYGSNNLRQKEKRRCVMVSSGILSTARITFDKRETKMRYGIFRYSLYGSNYLRQKRNEDVLWYLQVFSLRFELPSTKEKRRCVMVSSGILSTVRITFDKRETKMRYGIFRYSLYGSNHLRQKRNEDALWYLQVFSLTFELPSIKRNEDKLRCLQVFSSNIRITFDKENRGQATLSSGILIKRSNYLR